MIEGKKIMEKKEQRLKEAEGAADFLDEQPNFADWIRFASRLFDLDKKNPNQTAVNLQHALLDMLEARAGKSWLAALVGAQSCPECGHHSGGGVAGWAISKDGYLSCVACNYLVDPVEAAYATHIRLKFPGEDKEGEPGNE